MANIRLIRSNAADRATSIAASTTAGALAAANMQNDYKGQVHRSTGTSVQYTLTWTGGEAVGGIGLPATNLTASATIRARLYSDTGCTVQIADSGTVDACPGADLGLWDWSGPINANAFAYGGAAKTAVWFANQQFARGCKIDLVDTTNPAGYIDCARLVIGGFWEPTRVVAGGVKLQTMDTTQNARNESGDLLSDAGTVHDTLSLDLKWMEESDRAELMRLIRYLGTRGNAFVSVLPDNALSVLEQDHMIYGKRVNADVVTDFLDAYSHTLTMEGW